MMRQLRLSHRRQQFRSKSKLLKNRSISHAKLRCVTDRWICGFAKSIGDVRLGSFSAMSCGDGARGFAVRSPFGSGHADDEGAILRSTCSYQADCVKTRVKTRVSPENGLAQSKFLRLAGF